MALGIPNFQLAQAPAACASGERAAGGRGRHAGLLGSAAKVVSDSGVLLQVFGCWLWVGGFTGRVEVPGFRVQGLRLSRNLVKPRMLPNPRSLDPALRVQEAKGSYKVGSGADMRSI